jgi:large subunit ribosomal protein L25
MTKNTELQALPRAETGKGANRKLRYAGRIPAIMYGKDMEPVGLSLDQKATDYLFERISVENTIVSLYVEGEDEPIRALIREIQTLPHKPGILHVDFLRIQKGVAVELEIPVSLEGIPVGVRESGGVMEQMINEIRVRCIPSLIPEVIALDVTDLGVGDSLHVSDVELDERVEIMVDEARTICNVAVPKIIEVETEEEDEEGLEGEEGEEGAEAAEGDDAPSGDGE